MGITNERASKKQQELLSFVDGFIKGSGYGPSYREIMRALGYKSVSTVAIHVDGLIAKGYLRRADKSARSLEVVTLRERTHTETDTRFEAELLQKINSKNLDTAQSVQVANALKLIGLDDIAKQLQSSEETAQSAS